MSELAIFSIDKSNKKFTLQAADVPSEVQSYPVRVTATLENGTKITATKNVTIKVTPTISITGADTFVAKNGVGTSHYTFVYAPEKYNVAASIVSVTSNNSKVKVSNVTSTGFDVSTTDITEDASATITATVSIDGKTQGLTKAITVTYKEDSGPFILYNVGDSADVAIEGYKYYIPKMYFKVVDNYVEGEEYDDSAIEYEVWENNSSGQKTVATVGNGQALLLKSYDKTRWGKGSEKYSYFVLKAGQFKAYGKVGALDGYYTKLASYCYLDMFKNCISLIKAPELPATTLADHCYSDMFYGCTGLTSAPELPVTTLESGCYSYMFSGCTGLTSAPELPATILESGCYSYMFNGCTGLTSAPELPVTTLAQSCYSGMFYGCTSLTQAPELPVTTLAQSCYSGMFSGCTSLTQVPELPATTLADYCYGGPYGDKGMFQNCTGLTSLPENLLPATTLAQDCYRQMFQGCTGLTSLPENLLPATTLVDSCYRQMFQGCTELTSLPENLLPATTVRYQCYRQMFQGCTRLTSLPENLLPATTLSDECYVGMFQGCTRLTSLPENLLPATTLSDECYVGMFQGCTRLTSLPENLLPATTLAKSCYGKLEMSTYSGMFQYCTSLIKAPELPATTLESGCYSGMFYGCTKLNYVKALFTTTPGISYTNNWLYNVASSGTFVKSYNAEWDVSGTSGIPSGWEVQRNATHVSYDSLTITADDVNGRKTTTVIHYSLVETMLGEDGVTQFQRTITGNVVSATFEQNTSTTETKTLTISYTEPTSGLTATTTITQGVWVDQAYTVDLNSQWQESSVNPDSSLYDCYESFSNYHVANANAIMYITIVGYTEFTLYIRSYGESGYDYAVVGNLDATTITRTTSGVKAHTSGNPQSGTALSNYTKVTFSDLDGGEHRIPILYGKDGSSDSGTDKGYIIIEKNQ